MAKRRRCQSLRPVPPAHAIRSSTSRPESNRIYDGCRLTNTSRFAILPGALAPGGVPMQFDQLKRREFIALLGGAVVWPLAARAQQAERMRRIGVLMNLVESDQEGQARLAAFLQALQELGWADGRNIRIDYRWGAGDVDRFRRYAVELVALAPDVFVAAGGLVATALQRATRALRF